MSDEAKLHRLEIPPCSHSVEFVFRIDTLEREW